MKSSQLPSFSPISIVPRIRINKSVAALFAAALALGLGAQSALAQGGYYPQVAPLGGAPFIPNGYPIVSNPELSLIEYHMPAGKTLVTPPVAPKTAATLADYQVAVKAAATAAANGSAGPVTVASLSAEVAKYRSAAVTTAAGGLGEIAAGVIASASGAKQGLLEDIAFNAAKLDPLGATSGLSLASVFSKAAGDNVLVAGVGLVVNKALLGAVAGNPPPAALTPDAVSTLATSAIGAISGAPVANAATATPALKGALMSGMATTIFPTLAGSTSNIDKASSAFLANSVQSFVTAGNMTLTIMGALAATEANYGAIAQGGLRTNAPASAAIKAALQTSGATSAYTDVLIDAYATITVATAGVMAGVSAKPAAVVAAGATKFPTGAPQIVKDALNATGFAGAAAQTLIARGVAAAFSTLPQNIATAAVGAGGATLVDVTTAVTTAAPIGSAGLIARAVVVAGGLPNASIVADAAIAAAAAVSPASNKVDAYADIAFNISDAVKLQPAAVGNAAVTAEVLAILAANGGAGTEATSPGYVATVAAAAGAPANRAAILAAGNAAIGGVLDADSDAASTAGVGLLTSLTNNPLTNYHTTLANVTPGTSAAIDAKNLAVLEAATLGNSGDAAGALAAMIANSGTSVTALTKASISANNRGKQTAMTIVADVASSAKADPTGDIQKTIGHQILDNPTYVKEIATAATVVLPQFSHVIAHTVAFNAPTTAYDSVGGIYLHSRISDASGVAGVSKLAIGDRPAAAAAISGALTTGVLESTQLSAAQKSAALKNIVGAMVTHLAGYTTKYDDQTGGPANFPFKQSNGGVGTFTLVKSKGVAGGITGFVAQMVNPGDHLLATNPDLLAALLQATYNSKVLVGNTYTLDIAQAAAQAFGWVSGAANAAAAATTATDIALAIFNGGSGVPLATIRNAVDFGFDQALGGEILLNPLRTPGAGAGGLRNIVGNPAAKFYEHHSASGTPVSNIFSL